MNARDIVREKSVSLYQQKRTIGAKRVQNINLIKAVKPALKAMYAVLLSCILSCAVGPNFERPKPPLIERYTTGATPAATMPADGKAQRFEQGAKLVSDWWRLFNSSRLDAVVKEAIANNQSLQAAQASLRQSQNILRAGYGVFYPQLDANANASRQQSSPAITGGNSPGSIFNLFTLSATVSYALDVFGGQRRVTAGRKQRKNMQGDGKSRAEVHSQLS